VADYSVLGFVGGKSTSLAIEEGQRPAGRWNFSFFNFSAPVGWYQLFFGKNYSPGKESGSGTEAVQKRAAKKRRWGL